ncbi:MAG: hypothetical protein R3A78_01280 [Polyangiales bacterium]
MAAAESPAVFELVNEIDRVYYGADDPSPAAVEALAARIQALPLEATGAPNPRAPT